MVHQMKSNSYVSAAITRRSNSFNTGRTM